jgi:hypothetical protein
VLLVDRKREHARFVLKNERRAIPMMHVEVDNRCTFDDALREQQPDCNRYIVEETEALAVVRECVMEAVSG